jgi:Protein of unknown function (DUF3237)
MPSGPRNFFFDKKMVYACSYDPKLCFDPRAQVDAPGGKRVSLKRRGTDAFGSVFHVMDASSITGVDDRRHDCPTGAIVQLEETVVFREDRAVGDVEGRMTIQTGAGASIGARYTGKIHVGRRTPWAQPAPYQRVTGGIWLASYFETMDTRYHWLVTNACVAFGTWTAEEDPELARVNVDVNLDVYSAA